MASNLGGPSGAAGSGDAMGDIPEFVGAYDDELLQKAISDFYHDVATTVRPFSDGLHDPQLFQYWGGMLQELGRTSERLANNPNVNVLPNANLSPAQWNMVDVTGEIDLLFDICREKRDQEERALAQATEEQPLGVGQKFSKINQLATEVKLLNRFTVVSQPFMVYYPDNSMIRRLTREDVVRMNPGPAHALIPVRQESIFRRLLVRLLHLPGIFKSFVDPTRPGEDYQAAMAPRAMIQNIWRISRILTTSECELHRPNYRDEYNIIRWPAYFNWILELRRMLVAYVVMMKDILFRDSPTNDPATGRFVTVEDIRRHVRSRMDNPRVLLELQERSNSFLNDNPFPRLMLDLVAREYDFELALGEDHVNDTLFEKQVMTFDEAAYTHPTSFRGVRAIEGHGSDLRRLENYQGNWRKLLRDTGGYSRQRYAHRALVDWRGHRPWRKIYQLYDTEQPEKRWLKEAIQRFRNETLATPKDDSPLAPLFEDTTTPMGARRRAAKICGIHPIDFQEEDGLRQDQNSAFCPVCTKAFTPGNTTDSTVVHLNCHHLVHLKCIFEYWDAPGRYLHSCPQCGAAPPLTWQHMGIDPEVQNIKSEWAHNLFGYETENMTITGTHPSQRERALYDVPEPGLPPASVAEALEKGPKGYWLRENMNTIALLSKLENEDRMHWDSYFLGKPGAFRMERTINVIQTRRTGAGEGPYNPFDDDMNTNPNATEAQAEIMYLIREREFFHDRMERIAQIWEGKPEGRVRVAGARYRFSDAMGARNRERVRQIGVYEDPNEPFKLPSGDFMLPGARYPFEQERAYLRMKRRRKNAAARQKAREEKRGLFGLNSTGV